jgi:hypothetical protein
MTQNSQASRLTMLRGLEDRRMATLSELPYITEEGLVLIDRREPDDRRAEQLRSTAID